MLKARHNSERPVAIVGSNRADCVLMPGYTTVASVVLMQGMSASTYFQDLSPGPRYNQI